MGDAMARLIPALVLVCALFIGPAAYSSGADVQSRILRDIAAGNPIVVHIVVALCDNKYQGIVPVPKILGNGQDPNSNLYWGAAFGVRTFFTHQAGWNLVERTRSPSSHVLERVVFEKSVKRNDHNLPVFAVAEAWDGKEIKAAIERFMGLAAGEMEESLTVVSHGRSINLHTGGAAHIVAYVGHDGLMDFSLPSVPRERNRAPSKSSIVLACASRAFFNDSLQAGGSHILLVTTGLMAPEAYTLNAAIEAWVSGKSPSEVREAAAAAYSQYQKCSRTAARRLFTGSP
jgi:hypothetical protein